MADEILTNHNKLFKNYMDPYSGFEYQEVIKEL